MRDLIWLALLTGIMAVVTVNGLCYGSAWQMMHVTLPDSSAPAVAKTQAPPLPVAEALPASEASLAHLSR